MARDVLYWQGATIAAIFPPNTICFGNSTGWSDDTTGKTEQSWKQDDLRYLEQSHEIQFGTLQHFDTQPYSTLGTCRY